MKSLFDSTTLVNTGLKNRLWRSATWLGMATNNGYVSDDILLRYKELAKGGVALIITGFTNVHSDEQTYPGILRADNDDYIPGLTKLAEMVHKYDSKIIMQIGYGGSTTSLSAANRTIWGPSDIPNPKSGITPTAMTTEDIQSVITAMADAALRAKNAGFDGVQIHAAHGYLFSQFLSPYYNKRDDKYGGALLNRARIIIDTLIAIKEKTGDNYPILIKMHCDDEWGENGISVNDSMKIAKELEKNGLCGIEFSGGTIDPAYPESSSSKTKLKEIKKQSYFVNQTKIVADTLNVPVISVGGHRNAELMQKILNNSNISYFSLSRPLLSEPDLPNKWSNDLSTKPQCVSCNNCWTPDGNNCIINRKSSNP